jgi:hypothetical protein
MPQGHQGQAAEPTKSAIDRARRPWPARVPGWLGERLWLGSGTPAPSGQIPPLGVTGERGSRPEGRRPALARVADPRPEPTPYSGLPALSRNLRPDAGGARQAINGLKNEGLVHSEHGRGVFVRTRPTVRRLARNRFTKAWRESGGKGRGAYGVEASRRARRSSSAPPDVADPEVRFLRLTPPPSIPYQSFRARAGRSGGTGRHEPQ